MKPAERLVPQLPLKNPKSIYLVKINISGQTTDQRPDKKFPRFLNESPKESTQTCHGLLVRPNSLSPALRLTSSG